MRWGDQLREMADSTPHIHQPDVLRATLQRDSYLLLRGVLPAELVQAARAVVTAALHKQWQCIDTSQQPYTAAAIPQQPSDTAPAATSAPLTARSGVLLTGYQPVTHHPHSLALLESQPLASLLHTLTAAPVSTFHTKWVRVMSRGQRTDEHVDYYRFKRTAAGMLTVWVPLGDYRKEDGVLAVCEGSHGLVEEEEREEAEARQRCENGREEKEASGGGAEDEKEEEQIELPKGYAARASTLPWVTTDVQVGDVIIFDIRTIHASTANEGNTYRLSMDTRWQPTHLVPLEHKHSFRHFTP